MTTMAKIDTSMVSDELTTRGIDSVIPEYFDVSTWPVKICQQHDYQFYKRWYNPILDEHGGNRGPSTSMKAGIGNFKSQM